MAEEFLAWHFLPPYRRLRFGDARIVENGTKLTVEPPIQLCERGLHWSKDVIDAARFAPGPILSRVRVGGEVILGKDKGCSTERTHLWVADATKVLHEFACILVIDLLKITKRDMSEAVLSAALNLADARLAFERSDVSSVAGKHANLDWRGRIFAEIFSTYYPYGRQALPLGFLPLGLAYRLAPDAVRSSHSETLSRWEVFRDVSSVCSHAIELLTEGSLTPVSAREVVQFDARMEELRSSLKALAPEGYTE